jgi:predicted DNA binding CopG/RHH family protein
MPTEYQMLEELKRTATDLLRHIDEMQSARDPEVHDTAEAAVVADTVTLRVQSQDLERITARVAERGVYLGG